MGEEAYQTWTQLTVEELRAFFGFSILMGLNHLPSETITTMHYAPIADVISRQRFRDISRYLQFVDNDHLVLRGDPSYDRLGKVRPLIEHLGERFEALYNPTQNVAVDEAMIKFQGRSSLKQYMPMKPIKQGIKVWVLADSANGYFHKFDIYTGKQKKRQVGLGEYVVKTLTDGLKRKLGLGSRLEYYCI